MPLVLDGETYYSTAELSRDLGVTRQTLWRWRHGGSVPAGRRYRGRQVLFTLTEVQQIVGYANRLEPATLTTSKRS